MFHGLNLGHPVGDILCLTTVNIYQKSEGSWSMTGVADTFIFILFNSLIAWLLILNASSNNFFVFVD